MVALLLLPLACQSKSNWNALWQTLRGRNGRHTYEIRIRCENFQPRGRKIGWIATGNGTYNIAINGQRVWLTDSFSGEDKQKYHPAKFLKEGATEVRTFEVKVNGNRWRVPKSLTFDLLNLNLNGPARDYHDYGQAWLSKDGQRLVLKQSGSDGGGGYSAYFIFRPKGEVERRIYKESFLVQRRFG
jgi:hypothetical protein